MTELEPGVSSRATTPPSVSVIVPTHQRRVLVQRAIASVLHQSFQDFELIVVDDGSDDGTGAAVTAVQRVRYAWQPQRGLAAARNAGLACARGDVIAFLDSDDEWLPEHLAVIVALLRAHPSAVLACTSAGYRRGGHQRLGQARLVDPFPRILHTGLAGFVSSTAVRRDTLKEIGGFDERLEAAEDTDVWLRLGLQGRFVLLCRRTAVIHRSDDSLSRQARATGATLAGIEQSLRCVAGELAATDRADEATHVERALTYVEALRSLTTGSAAALRALTSVQPTLADEGGGYALHLLGLVPRPSDHATRSTRLQGLIEAWPDRRAPIVLALRGRAAIAALRGGSPLTAVSLLLSALHRDSLSAAARLARRAAVRSRNPARER